MATKWEPSWDEPVTISRADLFQLVSCARSYEHRLPHGIVEARFLALMTPSMQEAILRDATADAPDPGGRMGAC